MKYSGMYTIYTREELIERVKSKMSAKRFKHVLGVEKTALELADRYGVPCEKASIAALTHDYAKERSKSDFEQAIRNGGYDLELLDWGNQIWHGLIGADFVQAELAINDSEILQAIRVHTTGAAEMSTLDKVIYVADYIEPGRDFSGVKKARKIAFEDLDAAVAFETKQTLGYLVEKEAAIYPKTIETYNKWVANKQPRRELS